MTTDYTKSRLDAFTPPYTKEELEYGLIALILSARLDEDKTILLVSPDVVAEFTHRMVCAIAAELNMTQEDLNYTIACNSLISHAATGGMNESAEDYCRAVIRHYKAKQMGGADMSGLRQTGALTPKSKAQKALDALHALIKRLETRTPVKAYVMVSNSGEQLMAYSPNDLKLMMAQRGVIITDRDIAAMEAGKPFDVTMPAPEPEPQPAETPVDGCDCDICKAERAAAYSASAAQDPATLSDAALDVNDSTAGAKAEDTKPKDDLSRSYDPIF